MEPRGRNGWQPRRETRKARNGGMKRKPLPWVATGGREYACRVIVLAGSGRGLVRGARADDTWNVDQVIEGADVRALAADAGTLYAGTDVSGVWCSDDRGRTWRQVGLEDQRIRSLAAAHGASTPGQSRHGSGSARREADVGSRLRGSHAGARGSGGRLLRSPTPRTSRRSACRRPTHRLCSRGSRRVPSCAPPTAAQPGAVTGGGRRVIRTSSGSIPPTVRGPMREGVLAPPSAATAESAGTR